jgi:hypothetical protein
MLSDPLVSAALLDAASFDDVRVDEVPCHFTVRTPGDVFSFMSKCSPRGMYIYDRQPAHVQATIRQALIEAGTRILQDGGRISCPVVLASGAKR